MSLSLIHISAEHFLVSTRFKVLTLSLPDNKMEVVTVDSGIGDNCFHQLAVFFIVSGIEADLCTGNGLPATAVHRNHCLLYTSRHGLHGKE